MQSNLKARLREQRKIAGIEVSVVIPSYNMAWCIERALASCISQTYPLDEIVIVDDCSNDETLETVQQFAHGRDGFKYLRLSENRGHLAALRYGLSFIRNGWVALLDADDELLKDSVESRIQAAIQYHKKNGEWPQLVYGDLYRVKAGNQILQRFKHIDGRDPAFLCRELSLCQTSTIMLGSEAIRNFPASTNPYNTDDEIVLSTAKDYPITHCGTAVIVAHEHDSETRMSNSSHRRLNGITQLVSEHGKDVVSEHGRVCLFLWYLRVVRVFLEWQYDLAIEKMAMIGSKTLIARLLRNPWRLYAYLMMRGRKGLTKFLEKRFVQIYF